MRFAILFSPSILVPILILSLQYLTTNSDSSSSSSRSDLGSFRRIRSRPARLVADGSFEGLPTNRNVFDSPFTPSLRGRTRAEDDEVDDDLESKLLHGDKNNPNDFRLPGEDLLGHKRAALAEQAKSNAESKGQARILMTCGIRLAMKGQLKAAKTLLDDSVKMDPTAPAAHINLANILADLGQAPLSPLLAATDTSLLAFPTDASLRSQGEEAVESYHQAIDLLSASGIVTDEQLDKEEERFTAHYNLATTMHGLAGLVPPTHPPTRSRFPASPLLRFGGERTASL
jgi:hypothetical protein